MRRSRRPTKRGDDELPVDIDLGHDHHLRFMGWHPDRELNPQYAGIPDVERFGALVEHPDMRNPSKRCSSMAHFDLPEVAALSPDYPRWQVQSWEPLTLAPSLLCSPDKGGCGDHGFIQKGRWVPA